MVRVDILPLRKMKIGNCFRLLTLHGSEDDNLTGLMLNANERRYETIISAKLIFGVIITEILVNQCKRLSRVFIID